MLHIIAVGFIFQSWPVNNKAKRIAKFEHNQSLYHCAHKGSGIQYSSLWNRVLKSPSHVLKLAYTATAYHVLEDPSQKSNFSPETHVLIIF